MRSSILLMVTGCSRRRLRRLSTMLVIATVVALGACRDSTGPPSPAVVELIAAPGGVAGEVWTAQVTSVDTVVVRVTDVRDRPLANVAVAWGVTAGDGAVAGQGEATDARGEARAAWTLGQTVGPQTVTATVNALPPVSVHAMAFAGPLASVVAQQATPASTVVGTTVNPARAVVAGDAFGNPVAGVTVSFAVTDGAGTASGTEQTTDADGVAAVGSWTVGTTAGLNTLTATVAGFDPVGFTLLAEAGPPASMIKIEGDGEAAAAGTVVARVPTVVVHDAYQNPVRTLPVEFAVASGIVTPGRRWTTDGVARPDRWILGPEIGTHTLTATVEGLPSVTFTAHGEDPSLSFDLAVVGVHLNQGNQTLEGTIGGVSDRPGLLRVVAVANLVNGYVPPVRIRLFHGTSLVREELLQASGTGIPTEPDLEFLTHTYNLSLAAAEVVQGLAVAVELDPENEVPVRVPEDKRFPRDGTAASLDVVDLHPMRVHFIPVHAPAQGLTGNVTEANMDAFLTSTRQWIPVSTVVRTLAPTYTTSLDLSDGDNWGRLVAEIQAKRTAEGAQDEYYHGIVPRFTGIPWGGYAYIPSDPGSRARSGITHDGLPGANETVAHELGHNLGRWHSPCGGPRGVDDSYPHPDAVIGPPGFDIDSGTLQVGLRDYMSYCSPRWTSDYTYHAILQWRRNDPLAAPEGGEGGEPSTGVLVWGRIHSGGVELSPAFALEAVPVLPDGTGPNELRGLDADGEELFRVSFDGVALGHGSDPAERHFTFFVPLRPHEVAALATLDIRAPTGVARVTSALAASPAYGGAAAISRAPTARIDRMGGDWLRVRWDAARHSIAMVRDPDTGVVLSFARGGDIRLRAGTSNPARIEVVLSDGVQSRVADRE